ncbi:hypothetical protein NEOLEDRAFT_1068151 [Neolentinus lepideus HHB14362 ss-1]|uniref:Uncharacterized protein n=1 Tax=Neolentinus lepideus HHB14362 ss-1 TaxID=1314782 RepID=A0A165RM91_9AGAM|nr:hypothetical protein NEOLEDRAFT_1068151 [Neolentinus lepideus HHB14362 ss-1]
MVGSKSVAREDHIQAEEHLCSKLTTERFPSQAAGSPLAHVNGSLNKTSYQKYSEQINGSPTNPFAPFNLKQDWEVAHWAKLRGPGSTALTEPLQIEDVCHSLGLSYKDADTLNKLIDQLPGRPMFKREEVVVAGEAFEVYYRDVIACIQALYSDAEFAKDMIFVPE